jgi:putative ABC transport system permease protein
VGVFQSFSKEYDNRVIKMPLAAAQELLNNKGANTLVVPLERTEETSQVAARLRERGSTRSQEVRTWYELNDFHPKTVQLYNRQFGGLLFIILMMVVLSVVNAVNMTVFERTPEFGTARALGNRDRNVFQLVMLENALLGLIGSVIGAAAGFLLAMVVSLIGIPMPPPPNADLSYVAYIRVTPMAMAGAIIAGFVATMLAALLPARRMARMPVVAALRHTV